MSKQNRPSVCSAIVASLLFVFVGHGIADPTEHQQTTASDEWGAWERERDRTQVPASLFPEAVEVRIYAGTLGIHVTDDGKVTSSKFRSDGNIDNAATPDDGGALTLQEVLLLRKSVFYSPPPPAIPMCCIPRHAFVFYDKDGRYLGHLEVCFQCGCAIIKPATPPSAKLDWVVWNQLVLGQIVEAHQLSTHPQDGPNK